MVESPLALSTAVALNPSPKESQTLRAGLVGSLKSLTLNVSQAGGDPDESWFQRRGRAERVDPRHPRDQEHPPLDHICRVIN